MATSQFLITQEPLDVNRVLQTVYEIVKDTSIPNGAVTSFLGQVRGQNLGKQVLRLEYEAYEPLVIKTFEQIAAESLDQWPGIAIALHHRLGTLAVGETSVAIAAASPHRGESFAGCRYAIERIKQIAPIWKHEFFDGGDVWIEGATADPDDEGAREDAYRRACR
jgi:molybdopterin synthase catalytic subunit